MAITRVNHGTTATGNGNITPGIPASVTEGDILLCSYSAIGGTGAASMSGDWTLQYSANPGFSSFLHAKVWSCIYTGSGPSLLITNTYSGAAAFIIAYRNAIIDTSGQTNSGTTQSVTITYASLTPGFVNDMCVWFWHSRSSGANGAISGTNPVPTEELDTNDSVNVGFGYSDGICTDTNPTGARTSTYTISAHNAGGLVLLKDVTSTISAALGGSTIPTITEVDVVGGGKVITITLVGANWITN